MATALPASTEIVLSARAHATAWLCAGFGLLAGAAVAVPFGADIVAIVLSSIAVTPVIVGIVLAVVARRYERAVAALLGGACVLRWQIPAAQWRAHVAAERTGNRRFALLFIGLGALVGVGVAMAMAEDGERIAGSPELVWVLPPLAGAALGSVVAAVVRARQHAHFDRMERSPGVFCLGDAGLYLTGSYWPWHGVGISVRDVAIEGDRLVFQFAVGEGGQQAVRVPIAPGHEPEAQQFVAGMRDG